MADHTIPLTANQETLYAKYLVLFGTTEEEQMTKLKNIWIGQIQQSINDAGKNKFNGLSEADKIAFLES